MPFLAPGVSVLAQDSDTITMGLTTTLYDYTTAKPCDRGYVAGATPFDDFFEGTLDISSIPYQVDLDATESGTSEDGFPYQTVGAIHVDRHRQHLVHLHG